MAVSRLTVITVVPLGKKLEWFGGRPLNFLVQNVYSYRIWSFEPALSDGGGVVIILIHYGSPLFMQRRLFPRLSSFFRSFIGETSHPAPQRPLDGPPYGTRSTMTEGRRRTTPTVVALERKYSEGN